MNSPLTCTSTTLPSKVCGTAPVAIFIVDPRVRLILALVELPPLVGAAASLGAYMTDIVISKREAIGFCCDPIPGGWTYTLTQRLGNLLFEAEERYGRRDREWTLLGIEFGGLRPCLWYPCDRKHIS